MDSEIINGLWANGRDSIVHALSHFSDRSSANQDRAHHDKWIVASVYHAAECVVNVRLLQLEPQSQLFSKRGRDYFPSLSVALPKLLEPSTINRLSEAEGLLFDLLKQILDLRHQFMHRLAPEKVDISIAAMCMVGLLKYMERHFGEEASDLVWQSPPIEKDVVDAIRYTKLDEYGAFVAAFLREKYGDQQLEICPSCGVAGIYSSGCEACFEDMSTLRCPETDEAVYYPSWQRGGAYEIDCPQCGEIHAVP
jgi:hypothetical protein